MSTDPTALFEWQIRMREAVKILVGVRSEMEGARFSGAYRARDLLDEVIDDARGLVVVLEDAR